MTSGGKTFRKEVTVKDINRVYNEQRNILSQELITAINGISKNTFCTAVKRDRIESLKDLRPIFEKINNLDMEYAENC
jgi:hypothetical protein